MSSTSLGNGPAKPRSRGFPLLGAIVGRLSPRSVRGTLVFLLLVIMVPLLALSGVHQYIVIQQRRSQEFQSNLELTRAVAAAFDSFLADQLHHELTLGRALLYPGSLQQANQLLTESARGDLSISVYSWISPQGLVMASSRPESIGLDFGDRPYFRAILLRREWVVSDLLQVSLQEAHFVIARGLRDQAGVLLGVLEAVMAPQGLGGVLGVERPAKGSVVIVDKQGRAARPEAEVMAVLLRDILGESVAGLAIATAALLVALLVARRITVSLGHLQGTALAVGRGDLDRRAEVTGLSRSVHPWHSWHAWRGGGHGSCWRLLLRGGRPAWQRPGHSHGGPTCERHDPGPGGLGAAGSRAARAREAAARPWAPSSPSCWNAFGR